MHIRRSRYFRHRLPPEIISHAVWLYHRYCLSFRDVEDLLAERGIIVSHETIRQWLRQVKAWRRGKPCSTTYVTETS